MWSSSHFRFRSERFFAPSRTSERRRRWRRRPKGACRMAAIIAMCIAMRPDDYGVVPRGHALLPRDDTQSTSSSCSVAPARCGLLANASLPFISSIALYGDDVDGNLQNCSILTPNSRCAPISFAEAAAWYPYLSSLYGESSDLPDAASLGWFYYDPTLPLCAMCM